MSLHELNTFPGVTAQPDTATANFVFNHTMLRVKDITKSLDFYTRVLGFSLVEKRDFPEAEFSLYFLALVDKAQIPADAAERTQWMKSIPGILELTHNHGTENDADFASQWQYRPTRLWPYLHFGAGHPRRVRAL